MATAKNGRDQQSSSPQGRLTRRGFLGTTAAAAPLFLAHGQALGYAANERIQVAVVGVGGRGSGFVPDKGWSSVREQMGARVAALCDVNKKKAAESFNLQPDVPKFEDFRLMIDQMGSKLDAVVVATPDHNHAPPSALALRAGKHVFCEKGLTRTIQEARTVAELAFEKKRSTQMGNQAGYNERVIENVWAGRLGEIQTIHMWGGPGAGPRKAPEGTQEVPDYLNWDLWLGPAAERPFHRQWLQWHAWRDFATGNAGNWGPHSGNLPFKAMKIDSLWHADPATNPRIRVHVEMSETERIAFPRWSSIRYEVPARGDLEPIEFNHYYGAPEGRKRVEEHIGRRLDWGDAGERKWKEHGGCLIVGTEGMIKSTEHNSSFTLLPEDKFAGFEGPPQTLPRSGSHEREFTAACKGGPATMSNFDYAGPLVEFLLLANVATLVGETLEFDPLGCKVVNHAAADAALRREYRQGWSL